MLALLLGTGCSMFQPSGGEGEALQREVERIEAEKHDGGTPTTKPATPTSQPPSHTRVRLDGSLSLGDTENPALTSQELADVLAEMLEGNKRSSARSMIRLYPDIVAQLLINSDWNALDDAGQQFVAEQYQDLWGVEHPAYEALESSDRDSLAKNRAEFLKRLGENQPLSALQLGLSKQLLNDPILAAEAFRLEGIAYLMLEDHRRAAVSLDRAISQIREIQPVEANRIQLLLGETLRRAGNDQTWQETWQFAVTAHARLLQQRKLADPVFWKQAAFLRPITSQWPESVVQTLREDLQSRGLDFDSDESADSLVWASIGVQSLRRHESQNAVLSFKKSEAITAARGVQRELQMKQAIAMIDGGQAGPASAILLTKSGQPGLMADRAKAVLGTLKLQNGSLAQGMNLLQSAIQSSSQWPAEERLKAQADYGLAYLMRGKEDLGLRLLNQVYEEFRVRGDEVQANQCLANIATYYDKTDQRKKYKTAVRRLERAEAL